MICSPVFGNPAVAKAAQLLIGINHFHWLKKKRPYPGTVMSGSYASKKEVAYHLVPAVGRKVLDLGGNLEKGRAPSPMMPALTKRMML
jgi:hypothetical protein